MSVELGVRLKAVRKHFELSQRQLAKRSGVTNATISLIEQNKVSPSVSSLKKVLDGLPMSLADFFTFEATVNSEQGKHRSAQNSGATSTPVQTPKYFHHL